MNKLVYIILFAILVSCKSTSIAQENEKKSSNTENKVKARKPRFGDSNNGGIRPNVVSQNQIAPNTIHLKVVVLEVSGNNNICDKSYDNTGRMLVKNVKGYGSGIVNMISQNKELIIALRKGIAKDISSLQKNIDKEISIVVREKPCTDFNQTMYETVTISSID
ncbi:hypothetical protein GCM10009430_08120 [Aquimarina litoralis]|uniref:Lipoprotein n=1 Tax=Aquimarina litoralis TaxID=584605 RepID=A0ABN1IIT4_9FLAO